MRSACSLILLVLLFLCAEAYSQNRTTDSLERILVTAKDDTNKVKILDDLCWEYTLTKSKKSEEYARQMLTLSQKLNYKKGIGNSFSNLGAAAYMQSKNDSAITFFTKAFEARKALKDKAGEAGSLNNIAMCYQQLSDYSKAAVFYLQALSVFEELNDEARMAQANVNLGSLYLELKNYELSLSHAKKGLEGWQKLNRKQSISAALVNVGNAYNGMKRYKEAIENYEKALEIQKEIQNKYTLGRIYHNLADIYLDLKQFDKSERYIKLELPLKEEVGDQEGIASAHHALGALYLYTGKFDKSVEEYKIALALARKIGNLDNVKANFAGLMQVYSKKGEPEKVYEYAVLYDHIKDTLYNESNSRLIAEMQTKYETEKKEKENEELTRKTEVQELQIKNEKEKRKTQLILGLSLFVFAGGGAAFYFNRRKLKQKAEHAAQLAEEEKNRFKAVIEAEEKERSRIAQELHDGLGQMLSTARLNVAGLEDSIDPAEKEWLDKSLKIIDEACVEVRHISHNMMPSALIRLGLVPAIQELVNNINASKTISIKFETNLTESLGKSLDITIYRILQEVLNNMIKHAKASQIEMSVRRDNEMLMISMKDNGIGFKVETLGESKGLGWKNIFSRVSMMDGSIDINSEPAKGTIVFIKLKLTNA